MKCPFCEREINQEITEKLEIWGIIRIKNCPKCKMCIGTELKGFNKKKKGLKLLKDILEELKIKEKFRF